MGEKILRVYLQPSGSSLHPISRKVLTTARYLGNQGSAKTQGVLFTEHLEEGQRQALLHCGLDEVLIFEGSCFAGFFPELQGDCLETLEVPEIFLFPATPEGRILSAIMGARLHTGVTADCTELSFGEDGRLVQVRPAFSGNRLARILTDENPQIASLRFSMPVPEPTGSTRLLLQPWEKPSPYPSCWLDRREQEAQTIPLALVIGGGIRRKEDIEVFEALAQKLGAKLFCSRALVQRGWMERRRQIGLSGSCISAERMITLGVSGSLQFQAGLQKIGHLLAVDENPDTPLMALADTPIQGDLYEILKFL